MGATTRQYAQTVALLPKDLPSSSLNALDSNGRSPLRRAVEARNKPMTTWLLQQGAMPDHCGASRKCPILAAISLKDASFLHQLLEAGASAHVTDAMQQTPLNKALQCQHAEHLQLLVMFGANLDSQHAQFHFGSRQSRTVRQVIEDFPEGTSGAKLKLAIKTGVAARRQLVVIILSLKVAPDLVADILQLICAYAGIGP